MYSFTSYGFLLGVFAIEKFQFILTVAVELKMNAPEFFMLLVSFLPTVVDFIIPIVTLVTVYFVALQNREYLVFAAAGLGRKPFLQTTSVLALFVFALSLSVSGCLKPLASFNFRTAYERALEQVIERGPMGGRFLQVKSLCISRRCGNGGGHTLSHLPGSTRALDDCKKRLRALRNRIFDARIVPRNSEKPPDRTESRRVISARKLAVFVAGTARFQPAQNHDGSGGVIFSGRRGGCGCDDLNNAQTRNAVACNRGGHRSDGGRSIWKPPP